LHDPAIAAYVVISQSGQIKSSACDSSKKPTSILCDYWRSDLTPTGRSRYVDSLWIGEGFSYDSPPDNWLLEISGMPFGVFSDSKFSAQRLFHELFRQQGTVCTFLTDDIAAPLVVYNALCAFQCSARPTSTVACYSARPVVLAARIQRQCGSSGTSSECRTLIWLGGGTLWNKTKCNRNIWRLPLVFFDNFNRKCSISPAGQGA
jgi:hypothetical protein